LVVLLQTLYGNLAKKLPKDIIMMTDALFRTHAVKLGTALYTPGSGDTRR
jgi:hypothetical protein